MPSRNNVENATIIIERTSEIGLALAAINRAHYPAELAFDGNGSGLYWMYLWFTHQLVQSRGCTDIRALHLQGVCGCLCLGKCFLAAPGLDAGAGPSLDGGAGPGEDGAAQGSGEAAKFTAPPRSQAGMNSSGRAFPASQELGLG